MNKMWSKDNLIGFQFEDLALGVQEQHEGEERHLESREAQGRASGGRLPAELVHLEHYHAQVHPERRDASVR